MAVVNNSPYESDRFKMSIDPKASHIFKVRKNGRREIDLRINHDAFHRETEEEVLIGFWLAPGQMEVFRLTDGEGQ